MLNMTSRDSIDKRATALRALIPLRKSLEIALRHARSKVLEFALLATIHCEW